MNQPEETWTDCPVCPRAGWAASQESLTSASWPGSRASILRGRLALAKNFQCYLSQRIEGAPPDLGILQVSLRDRLTQECLL